MAYRRPSSTKKATSSTISDEDDVDSSSSSWLAAKAIRASSAHRDSSLSSAYSSPLSKPTTAGSATSSSPSPSPSPSPSQPSQVKDSNSPQYTSMKNLSESKHGFWGNLARKAKAILDDEPPDSPGDTKAKNTNSSAETPRKLDSPGLQRGLDAITSSINYIGGTIGNAVEEGISIIENRTAVIIQETRKHIRKKPDNSVVQNQAIRQQQLPLLQADQELQLKASRDVRWQLYVTGSCDSSI